METAILKSKKIESKKYLVKVVRFSDTSERVSLGRGVGVAELRQAVFFLYLIIFQTLLREIPRGGGQNQARILTQMTQIGICVIHIICVML